MRIHNSEYTQIQAFFPKNHKTPQNMGSCLTRCSSGIQSTLESLFGTLGRNVGDNPWKTIFATLIFSFLFGIGFIGWTTEYRIDKLWIPPDSRAVDESDWIVNTFGYETRSNEILLRPNDYSQNVLTPFYIQQYWIAHYLLVNTSSTAPSEYQSQFPGSYSWDGYQNSTAICFRRGQPCQMFVICICYIYLS